MLVCRYRLKRSGAVAIAAAEERPHRKELRRAFDVVSTAAVTTIAGTGVAGSQDGAGTSALMNRPVGMGLMPDGKTLLVSTLLAAEHRAIPEDSVSTLVGDVTYTGAGEADGTVGGLAKN